MEETLESAYSTLMGGLREAYGLFEALAGEDGLVRDWLLIDGNPALYGFLELPRETALAAGLGVLFGADATPLRERFDRLAASASETPMDFRLSARADSGEVRAFRVGPRLVALLHLPPS